MHMKYLNLRKNYPNWNWTQDEKRQRAYNALVNKGNTSLFKKTVWNEMVDCLYNALIEVGLEWDEEYGTYERTKYPTGFLYNLFPMVFTAKKFNAVRKNIQKVINSTFIWQYDTNYEGYVGRDNYMGYAETEDADTLYGSALLELARKLNLLIDILKDEANTLDKEANVQNAVSSNSTLAVPELSKLDTYLTESLEAAGEMSNTTPKTFSVDKNIESSPSADIKLKDAKSTLKVQAKYYTHFDAVMELEELYSNLYATIYHFMTVDAKLIINYLNVKITAQVPNILTQTANIDFADVSRLVASSIAEALTEANLGIGTGFELDANNLSTLLTDALMTTRHKRLLKLRLNPETVITASVENIKGSTFVSLVSHISRPISNLNKGTSKKASSVVTCRAQMSIPDLIRCIVNPMNPELVDCVCDIDNEMHKGIAESIGSDVNSEGEIESDMVKGIVERMGSELSLNLEQTSEVHKMLIRLMGYTKNYKAEIESAMVRFEKLLQESNVTSSFTDNLRLDLCSSGSTMEVMQSFGMDSNSSLEALNYGENYPKTNSVYSTYFDLVIDSLEPYPIQVNEIFKDTSNALAETLDAEQSMKINVGAFEVVPNTNIAVVNLKAGTSEVEYSATAYADITFDPASWYNPVQIGSLLEIYQAYETTQTDTNLDIE